MGILLFITVLLIAACGLIYELIAGAGIDVDRVKKDLETNAKAQEEATKAVVQDRLKALHADLDTGVRASPNYTLRRAAEDWLSGGLNGRSAKTIKKNENVLAPILASTGARRLRELTADDVHQALTAMARSSRRFVARSRSRYPGEIRPASRSYAESV